MTNYSRFAVNAAKSLCETSRLVKYGNSSARTHFEE
jgi:hypothetical protein